MPENRKCIIVIYNSNPEMIKRKVSSGPVLYSKEKEEK